MLNHKRSIRALTPVIASLFLVLVSTSVFSVGYFLRNSEFTFQNTIQNYKVVEIHRIENYVSVWIFGYSPFNNLTIFFDSNPVYSLNEPRMFNLCVLEGNPDSITIELDGKVLYTL